MARMVGIARARRGRSVVGAGWLSLVLVLMFQFQAKADPSPDLQKVDEQLQTFVETVESLASFAPFTDALPLGDMVPAEALALADFLDDEDPADVDTVKDELVAALGSLVDADDLADALDDLDGTYAGVTVTVSGPGADTGDADTQGEPVVVDGTDTVDVLFELRAARTVDVPLDFATSLVDLVAAAGSTDGTFDVEFAIETSTLHFQLDKALAANPATAAQALSLRTLTGHPSVAPAETPSIRLSAETASGPATLDDFTTNLGFTEIVVDGSLAFDVAFRLDLGDPDDPTPFDGTANGDQKISADEWSATALDDLVRVVVDDDGSTDAVNAQISVDSDLTATDPDFTVSYVDASLADAVSPSPDFTPDVPSIADLRNFSADEALAAVFRLMSLLQGFQATGRLDVDLPLISGHDSGLDSSPQGTFSDAVDLGGKLQAAVDDPTNGLGQIVDDGSPPAETVPTPTFSNAQEMQDKLAAFLGDTVGLTYHPDSDGNGPDFARLEFTVELNDGGTATTDLAFGNLDILSSIIPASADATASLDADYTLDLKFALDLSAQPTEDGAGIGSCTDGIDNGAEDLDAATPADGADAGDSECAGTETLEQRVATFVGTSNSPELTARAGLAIDDVDASARIGLLEAQISGAHVAIGSTDGEDGGGPAECVDGLDNDGSDGADMADPDCRAALVVDINEAGGDGWLTVQDMFNAFGASPPAGVSIAATLDAALDALVPVSANLGGAPIGSGDITATASHDGALTDAGQLLDSLAIDAANLHATDLLNFSPCSGASDDDGDGAVNDGCPAVDAPETACGADTADNDTDGAVNDGCATVDDAESSSTAMLSRLFAGVRLIADQLRTNGLLPASALDEPLPFIGASLEDLLDYGETLSSMVDNIEDAGESALVDSGLDPDACTDNEDSDFDGIDDDGCPTAGADSLPETDCADDGPGPVDDDNDGDENDGCAPAIPSLQQLAAQLDGYLTNLLDRIPDTTADGVTVGNDTVQVTLTYDGGGSNNELNFNLTVDDLTLELETPFNVDLPGQLSSLVSLDAQGNLDVDVVGDLTLAFGVELDTFTPFLRDSTQASIAANAAGTDLFFGAGVGPLRILVGQETATPEEPGDCGGTTDNDGDGVANDGCPTAGGGDDDGDPDPETACTGTGSEADDDGDGVANDGCAAVADRARVFLGGQASITQDDVAGDGDKAYLPGGPAPTASFSGAAGGTDQAGCNGLSIDENLDGTPESDGTQAKDACAVLPLYFDNGTEVVPIGSLPHGHQVKAAIVDLSSPTLLVEYDTSQLLAFIEGQLIDLLLLNSGLADLLDRLEAFLENVLFNSGLPLIGDQLDDAAALVDSLREGLRDAITQATAGGNPIAAITDPTAADVQNLAQGFASTVGERLDGDGVDDLAAILLDSDDPGTDVTEADLRAIVKCGDHGSRDCDTGFGENDPANPALEGNPTDCTGTGASADDDGDGVANDGCDPVEAPETTCEADGDPQVDDDGDGFPDDGCGEAGDPPADNGQPGEAGADCENHDDDDGDGAANDGCPAVAEPGANVTDIQFTATLGLENIAATSIPLNFDASLPGLGLAVENAFLNGDIDWSIDVGFGVNKDSGFYFLVGDPDEIALSAGIQVSQDGGPAATITGTLAFLEVTIQDLVADSDGPSSFDATFAVDVLDPGTEPNTTDKLTFTELQNLTSFSQLVNFTLDATANVDVHVETGFSDDGIGLPKVVGDLHLDWQWDILTPSGDPEDLDPDESCASPGDCLTITLDNLHLDVGSFVSNFLRPVFADVQRFTAPFDPIIDKLNEPIPVLSDLAGEPITLLTLAETFGPSDQSYDLIISIVKLVDFVNSLDFSGPTILIPIGDGSFELAGERLEDGEIDPTQAREAFEGGLPSLASLVDNPGGPDINENVGTTGSSELKIGGLKDIGVSFPFLEHPERLLGILFGQDVDLVVWEPPPLSIGFSYSQKFGPIWAVPPVFLEIGGSVSVTGTFGIGYSSKGFRAAFFEDQGPAGLLRGLFLVDRHPLEGGPDSNELELRGELFANAQVSVLIFSAGAEGSVFLTIGIDLQDPNGDGRLEYGEAADIIRTTGNVLCIFNLNGQFGVEISVFAEVDLFFWSQRWEKTLAKIILYEFKVECDPLADPVLAHADGTVLILHMGPNRHLRDPDGDGTPNGSIGFDQVNEQFIVTRTPTGVTVAALGYVQTYNGPWTTVRADGGTGNDVVTLADGVVGEETECADLGETLLADLDDDGDGSANDGCQPAGPDGQDPPEKESGGDCAPGNVADDDSDGFVNDGCPTLGDPVPFDDITGDLSGGPGNDQITGGLAADTIDGDGGPASPAYDGGSTADGADTLNGREGVNTIHGNGHNDKITSGASADDLFGDAGNDTIDAGLGGDDVEGGDGEDAIDGGRSTTSTTPQAGKPGQPTTAAVDGNDTIYGDSSTDATIGARDTIDAGDGDDDVFGGPGGDRVLGGKGADDIDGGDETGDPACLAATNDPDDVLVGGPDADEITAGDGDDIVVGGSIVADQPDVGDTLLDGGDDCDVVIGDNATFTSETDPRAFSLVNPDLGGGDTIEGGNHADRIRGQVGDDVIDGDDPDDAGAEGSDGGDDIEGNDGDDDVDAQGGNDTVRGGAGDDDLVNGNGNDTAFGDAGIDIVLGDKGSVAANGAGRADDDPTMSGGTGVDVLRGGSGNDRMYGQGAGDTLHGDSGLDEMYGDGDDAVAAHVAADGNDTLHGGMDDDYVFGNNGADKMFGDSGDDRMVGGSPNATSADTGTLTEADGTYQDRMYGDFGADVMAGDNATIAVGADPVLLAEATIGEGDLMLGQGADDRMFGENGNDDLFGGTENDHAEGGDDDDELFGESGQDDLIGGTTEHADVVPAGATNGQPDGNDILVGGSNADVLAGDNAEITRSTSVHPNGAFVRDVTIDDLDYTGTDLSGEDRLSGNASHDDLYGGAEADQLWGNDELDSSPAADGDDHLEGNGGPDDLFGHGGQDDLIGGTSAEAGPPGDPGGGHPDQGSGAPADEPYDGDDLSGGPGHDVLAGDNASIQRIVNTVPNPDEFFLDDLQASRGVTDVLRRRVVLYDVATLGAPLTGTTTSGDDEVFGNDGHDQAYGQGGGDLLDGGPVDDHLEGNAGPDKLLGQEGQDDLVGGTGRTTTDDPATAEDGRLDDADELYGGDGGAGDGAIAADDFDTLMGDNATVLRGDADGTLGAPWEVNAFNGSVKRYLFLYDVAEVGKSPQAHEDASGGDLMRGQANDDVMYGQGGPDDMEGGSGDDYMEGNDGADDMLGQGDNDDMVGGTGAINDDDPVRGRDGRHDEGETGMSGGDGFDWMAGDNAVIRRVLVNGEWVPSTVNDGIDHERIFLRDVNSPDQDVVSGGDAMHGDAHDDVMYGQANRDDAPGVVDLMFGDGGDDYMEGNAGADEMHGNADQDDMVGGTGLVNDDDPATGTKGRWDADDKMQGNDGHDTMTGDNALLVRQTVTVNNELVWRTQTYRHFFEDQPSTDTFTRVARDVTTVDDQAGLFSGSDLMRGGEGDDEMHGQLDDTAEGGGYPAAEQVAWCELVVPAPGPKVPAAFSPAAVDAEGKARGDILCSDGGEDVVLGDGGNVDDEVEGTDTANREAFIRPNEPFIDDRIFPAESLTRHVVLLQIPAGGDDVMLGGPDGDSMHGGAGNDLVNGQLGDDRLFGDDGSDALWGGRDHDHEYGGYGPDFHDVRPRTAAVHPPNGDPMAWFLYAPDDPTTTQTVNGVAHEEYDGYHGVDYTYGGFDQDAHQANVGDAGRVVGDRLMDWAGSYNAYYLCPAVFGERVITRDMSPSLILFWERLAGGDGADPATIGQGGDKAIHSGFDELAMVYKPDVKVNQKPVHPDTPGHFTCDEPLPVP